MAAEGREDSVWMEEHIQCPTVPHCSPQSLQVAMQLVNIQTLAFTPPHTLPWKVFLYTRTQRTGTADTPRSTLILGELLYTGEANQRRGAQAGTADRESAVEMDATADGLEEIEDGEQEVKVTLKQQPRDDKALRGFLSILTTVLHTLSSEKA